MDEFSLATVSSAENNASVMFRISGAVTLSGVGKLLLQLAGNFDRAEHVVIDLSEVTEIDVAGLQLFCSCHRSSLLTNKDFSITGQHQPAVWSAAAAIGCLRKSGCSIDTKHTCIWAGGTC